MDPPSIGHSGHRSGLPFSIDAALSATIPSYNYETLTSFGSTLDPCLPRGWTFDIHEDTPEEELENIMQFSTQTLEISDDECRPSENDDCEKENIPPYALTTVVSSLFERSTTTFTGSQSRKNMMSYYERKPLRDLDAREFYAKDCDSNSWIIIPVETERADDTKSLNFIGTNKEGPGSLSPANAAGGNQDVWKELLAQVEAKNAVPNEQCHTPVTTGDQKDKAGVAVPDEPLFEIWESGSAKGDGNDL